MKYITTVDDQQFEIEVVDEHHIRIGDRLLQVDFESVSGQPVEAPPTTLRPPQSGTLVGPRIAPRPVPPAPASGSTDNTDRAPSSRPPTAEKSGRAPAPPSGADFPATSDSRNAAKSVFIPPVISAIAFRV